MEFKTVREAIDFWFANNLNVSDLFKKSTKIWLNKSDYVVMACALREFYGMEPCTIPFNIFMPKKRKRGDGYPYIHIHQGLAERVHVLISMYENKDQFLEAYRDGIVLVTHHINHLKWDARSKNLQLMTYEDHCELHGLKPNPMKKEKIQRNLNSWVFRILSITSSRNAMHGKNFKNTYSKGLDTIGCGYFDFDLDDDFTTLYINGGILNIYLP